MSGKEILKLSSTQLDTWTDAALREYFAPCLKMIKPEERKEKESNGDTPTRKAAYRGPSQLDRAVEMANRMAKELGLPPIKPC